MGIVLHTRELRWFYRGSLPAELLRSFQNASVPGSREQRSDWYFVDGDRPDLGLKVRDGCWFDLKHRNGVESDRAYAATMRGDVERWTKWSFALDTEIDGELPLGSESWVRIDKSRWVRRYEFEPGGRAHSVPMETAVETGCNIELADVLVNDAASWSLGFEAFGSGNALDSALSAAVNAVIADTPRLADRSFASADSYGYPSWLIRMSGLE